MLPYVSFTSIPLDALPHFIFISLENAFIRIFPTPGLTEVEGCGVPLFSGLRGVEDCGVPLFSGLRPDVDERFQVQSC